MNASQNNYAELKARQKELHTVWFNSYKTLENAN